MTEPSAAVPFLRIWKMDGEIRIIHAERISDELERLLVSANKRLPDFTVAALERARAAEADARAVKVLDIIGRNLDSAACHDLPICQDTGMAVVFVSVGKNIHVADASLEDAINEGVRRAYVNGGLRLSVVRDPLFDRVNTQDNTPAVIHIEMNGDEHLADKLCITVAPKGFGSENMSRIKMMTPAATPDDVVDFVCESVRAAGSNPCPPIFVGVGIGGDFESCALLAKRALIRESANPDARYAELERRMLERINALGIGPQGFGGRTTALGVMIEQAPTHIAGLPVAVNINCHVSRHMSVVI